MEPVKTDVVMYVDSKGVEHKALVTAINGLHPHHLSLAYVDPKAAERENIKQVFDVPHIDDNAVQESNPDLPTIHLNCWKYEFEDHTVAAPDHPMFDHPFAAKPTDEDGRVIEKQRPEYDAQVAAHQKHYTDAEREYLEINPAQQGTATTGQPSAADLDKVAEEQKAADATAEKDKGLLQEIGDDIKKGAEAVAETAVDIALSGLGASQE